MLNREIDHSSYKPYWNCYWGRPLAIRRGLFAPRTYSGRLCPGHHAVSIQIVSQIPQANLGFHPDQTNGPHDQPPRPLRLNPEDVFHTTPNPGPSSIPLGLSICQSLVPASFALKMLPVFPFLQRLKFFLRTICRVCPHIPTAVILIQKFLKDLTVMDRRWRHLIIPNQFMLHVYIDMIGS